VILPPGDEQAPALLREIRAYMGNGEFLVDDELVTELTRCGFTISKRDLLRLVQKYQGAELDGFCVRRVRRTPKGWMWEVLN
jgi:hypothetical protein